MTRRVGAVLVLLMLLAGGVPAKYLRYPFIDRNRLEAFFGGLPDARTPSYPEFLEQVRLRTSPGDSIAILVPMRRWNEGYAYAFFRASYILAGRTVVPLVDPNDRILRERLAAVDYLAAWRTPVSLAEFPEVWKGADGVLLERVR